MEVHGVCFKSSTLSGNKDEVCVCVCVERERERERERVCFKSFTLSGNKDTWGGRARERVRIICIWGLLQVCYTLWQPGYGVCVSGERERERARARDYALNGGGCCVLQPCYPQQQVYAYIYIHVCMYVCICIHILLICYIYY